MTAAELGKYVRSTVAAINAAGTSTPPTPSSNNRGPIQPDTSNTYYVNDGSVVPPVGNDTNDCLSAAEPCLTIAGAIGKASNLDTIIVEAGTYNEGNVTVDKALDIQGANYDIAPPGTKNAAGPRGDESTLSGTFRVASSGVSINGFTVTGAGRAVEGSGAGPWSNVSITNNIADANTGGQMIVYGFGFPSTSLGATNWTVSDNRITDIQAANATAIVMFNIDDLTVEGNFIRHDNSSFDGRRGMNIDGGQTVTIADNDVFMGVTNPTQSSPTPAFTAARYPLQLSGSDRSVSDVTIKSNKFGGAYDGVITLGNEEYSDILIRGNTIDNVVFAIRTQAGTNQPDGKTDGLTISNNRLTTTSAPEPIAEPSGSSPGIPLRPTRT